MSSRGMEQACRAPSNQALRSDMSISPRTFCDVCFMLDLVTLLNLEGSHSSALDFVDYTKIRLKARSSLLLEAWVNGRTVWRSLARLFDG